MRAILYSFLLLTLITGVSFANERPATTELAPHFTLGMVVGEAGDALKGRDGTLSRQILVGAGLELYRQVQSSHYISLQFDLLYKNIENLNAHVLGYLYAAGWSYKFNQTSQSSIYTKVDFGISHFGPQGTTRTYDSGINKFITIGLGHLRQMSKDRNNRVFLYYRIIFPSKEAEDVIPFHTLDYSVTYFGFTMSFGIGL